jgi:hypothetical protein
MYIILVSENPAMWSLGKPVTRCKDGIRMDVTECEDRQ